MHTHLKGALGPEGLERAVLLWRPMRFLPSVPLLEIATYTLKITGIQRKQVRARG